MGGIRVVDIVVGYETSTQPTAITPSDDSDVITKGYADDTYTPYASVGANVDDITALKAVASADRYDEQLRFVNGLDLFYQFDAASTATPDDDLVVQPNSGTGRWIKIEMGGGGGGGAGGSGIEQLLQKLEQEKSGIFTDALDNSIGSSGMAQDYTDQITGRLLKDTSSGATALEIAWSPKYVNDSDKDTNSTTSWSAVGAGASLTTNGTTKQIGSASLQFDKNNSATEAGIRFSRGAQDLSLGATTRAYFYINLPSITNLSDVYIKVYKDSTSNYRKYTKTTDCTGTALATGWNLICVDLENDSGTNTGTGWTISDASSYVEFGVDTSSAGQTYTAILLDSVCFSIRDPLKLGLNGAEVTLFDTSNKQAVIIDVSNTKYDGRLTLKSGQTLTNTATGGVVSAAALNVKRTPMSLAQGTVGFDSSLTSGTISTQSEIRLSRMLRETKSGSSTAVIDLVTPQFYRVTAVGGSTIDVSDSGDTHLNLLNGDVLHHFKPYYSNGRESFIHQANKTMTANSTYSSGTTTITVPVSGIAVGDYVVKKHVTAYTSMVAASANESFSSMTEDAIPNGIQVVDNFIGYPNRQNASFNYPMGGINATQAFTSKIGNYPTDIFTAVGGTPNYQGLTIGGRNSFENGSGSKYRTWSSISDIGYSFLGPGTRAQLSFWVYYPSGATGGYIMSNIDSAGSSYGWDLYTSGSTFIFRIFNNGLVGSQNITVPQDKWVHVFIHLLTSTNSYITVNGVKYSLGTNPIGFGVTHEFSIFGRRGAAGGAPGLSIADIYGMIGGVELTQQEVLSIYNNGNYRPFETGGIRYKYTAAGQSGQKYSMKAQLDRSTTAVSPALLKVGSLFSE